MAKKRKSNANKSKKMSAKNRKLLINSVIIIIILISSYFLNSKYNFISDLVNDFADTNLNVQNTVNVIAKADNDLLIHFVDVGQGDCIIIELPDGKNMIIDGGPTTAKNSVLQFINSYNITTFDYLMLTHTDEDHCGSLDDVITNTVVKKVFMPEISTELITTVAYANFVNAVNAEGLAQEDIEYSTVGDKITGNNYEILFFTPLTADYINAQASNANVLSPIIILKYGEKRVMFTGDATADSEEEFLAAADDSTGYSTLKNEIIDVDVLKVSHHGSNASSTADFLAAVKPEISVISVGADNSYGHPGTALLSRLEQYSQKILRTDLLGDITIKLTPDELGIADITEIYTNSVPQNVSGITINAQGSTNLVSVLFINRSCIINEKYRQTYISSAIYIH